MPNSMIEPQFDPNGDTAVAGDMLDQIFKEEQIKLQEQQDELDSLAKEIEKKFSYDAAQRSRKESEWYWAERLQLGSMWNHWNSWSTDDTDSPFDDDRASGKSSDKPEFNIVRPKIKIGKAQLEMLQFGAGTDKNFSIKAKVPSKIKSQQNNQTPVFYQDGQTPMVDPTTGQPMTVGMLVMQQSATDLEQARKMDEEVWSQMEAADYGAKMRRGFDDMLWYGSAIYKGPFNNSFSRKVRYCTKTTAGQPLWVSAYTEEPAPDFELVNPWMFYPDSRAITIDDAEHATVVHVYTPTKLRNLVKLPGFRVDEIKELLSEAPNNMYAEFRARAVKYNNADYLKGKYVILEWHGTIGADALGHLGLEPPYENVFDLYKAEIWVCQGEVIYATLEMLEANNHLPFAVNTWEPDPASLFGFGAVQLRDAQRVVNMTYDMVLTNAGLAALPLAAIDKEGFEDVEGFNVIKPGAVFYKTENGVGRSIKDMIELFYIPDNTQMLSSVLNMARQFGEEESIIPLMAGGMGDPKLGDSGATGVAMVMQASTSVLSSKAREWDDNITKKVVEWFYEWNMQYSEKEDIKGDYSIDVQTSTAYLQKIIGQRDIERLNVRAAQDPEMKYLIDRTESLRAELMGYSIPYDAIVNDKDTVAALKAKDAAAAAQAPPDPATTKAQADLINAQAHQASVQNDAQKIQFDATQGVQEAQMAAQQAQANYATRNNEAQARALDAASKRDVAIAQLAAKNKQGAQQLVTQLQIHQDQQETAKFVAGVSAHQTAQKLSLEAQNTAIKQKHVDHAVKRPFPKPSGSKK